MKSVFDPGATAGARGSSTIGGDGAEVLGDEPVFEQVGRAEQSPATRKMPCFGVKGKILDWGDDMERGGLERTVITGDADQQ